MTPETLRTMILAEHDWIRAKLRRAEHCAVALLAGEIGRGGELRSWAKDLIATLRGHLQSEDDLLLPTLEAVDAWGPVRAERLRAEHAEQRAELSVLGRLTSFGAAAELAYALLPFARALREDMAQEEQLALSEELLRDDLVVAEQLDA